MVCAVAMLESLGFSPGTGSPLPPILSVASEKWSPTHPHSAPDTDSSTDPSTDLQDVPPVEVTEAEKEKEAPFSSTGLFLLLFPG